MVTATKWYTFSQNNSGGGFDVDEDSGIGYAVIVEAESSGEASDRAEKIGLYFNGVEDGMDCECCGDRWHPVSDRDGKPEPMIYSEKVTLGSGDLVNYYGIESFIHPLSGKFGAARSVK